MRAHAVAQSRSNAILSAVVFVCAALHCSPALNSYLNSNAKKSWLWWSACASYLCHHLLRIKYCAKFATPVVCRLGRIRVSREQDVMRFNLQPIIFWWLLQSKKMYICRRAWASTGTHTRHTGSASALRRHGVISIQSTIDTFGRWMRWRSVALNGWLFDIDVLRAEASDTNA